MATPSHYERHPIPEVLYLSWVAWSRHSLPPGLDIPWALGKDRDTDQAVGVTVSPVPRETA